MKVISLHKKRIHLSILKVL